MELYLVIGLITAAAIAIAYKFRNDALEREAQRKLKEEELEKLQHEFLVRYARNRKGSTTVDDDVHSMILQDMMNSDVDIISGTITYDEAGKPTLHPTTR